MQSSQSNTRTYVPRGGYSRPQYGRHQRWTPPPEPKPEPKLDLSERNFPTLSNNPVAQTTGHHDFQSSFTTTVKVMAEMEKLQELREQRDREASQKARVEMRGVYIDRFQPGRLSKQEVVEPEEDDWRPAREVREPGDDEWTEVRHSKARKQPREKSMRELAEEYQSKAIDEENAEDYNGELFESSHRHDHYAT